MTIQAIHKKIIFSLIINAGALFANNTLPQNTPYKNTFNKTESASRAPKQCSTGPGGIPIMPQSDLFPNDVTPEMAQVIIEEQPSIARKLKSLEDPESDEKPSEILLLGEPGVGKTAIAAAIAIVLNRKTVFLKSGSLAGNEMQNSGIIAIETKLGVILTDMKKCNDSYTVIIDELAPLTAAFKDDNHPHLQAPISHLWLTLDELRRTGRVLVVATANEENDIPDQIRSRAKRNTFYISEITPRYREKTLHLLLKNKHTLSDDEIKKLSDKMAKQGYNIREMQDIVLDAFEVAYHRGIKKINKGCADRAFEVYVKRNTKGWVESFNNYCKKHKTTIENICKISLALGGTAWGWTYLGPYVVTFLKSAAATKTGVLIISTSKIVAGTMAAKTVEASGALICIGLYKGLKVYIDKPVIDAIMEAREVSEEEAKEIMLRSVKKMAGEEQ